MPNSKTRTTFSAFSNAENSFQFFENAEHFVRVFEFGIVEMRKVGQVKIGQNFENFPIVPCSLRFRPGLSSSNFLYNGNVF